MKETLCTCGRRVTPRRKRCLDCYRTQRSNPSRVELEARFWPRVTIAADGCWNWTGQVSPRGYAQFFIDGRNRPAHRTAYEWTVGPIPAGLVIDHLCRNRRCVNPAHLEAVTSRTNTLRGVGPTAELARRDTCPLGHDLDGQRTDGHRYCLTCNRARNRRWYESKALEARS